MRIFIAFTAVAALAFGCIGHPGPAAAQARPHVKHPHARTATVPPYRRPIVVPPGYSYGGSAYSTCDRINRDRMLVGTCR